MNSAPCLTAAGFGVSFGSKVVLADLDFSLPADSITALVGPRGAGKSTLLKTLAGLNDGHPQLVVRGNVVYGGRPLADGPDRPRMAHAGVKTMASSVLQVLSEPMRHLHAYSAMQWRDWVVQLVESHGLPELAQSLDKALMNLSTMQIRAVCILREALRKPELLLLDEPTTGLSEFEAFVILDLLRGPGMPRSLFIALRELRQIEKISDKVMVLDNGRLQEFASTEHFLSYPTSNLGRGYVQTGQWTSRRESSADAVGVAVTASDDARAVKIPELVSVVQHDPEAVTNRNEMPDGFAWLQEGVIAGMNFPGQSSALERDLMCLRRKGVSVLVTLADAELPQEVLQRYGMSNLHLHLQSEMLPSKAQIQMLLKRVELSTRKNEVLAVACDPEFGGSGLLLAAWALRKGSSLEQALGMLASMPAGYVLTADQEAFLALYQDVFRGAEKA